MIPFSGLLQAPPAPIDYWDDNGGGTVLYGEGPTFAQNPWDVVFLNGDPLPGLCKVKATPTVKFDTKKPGGVDGLTITGQGYLPGPVDIEVVLWTQEQWEFFQAIADKIWIKPRRGQSLKAIDISHPGTDLWKIKSVVVQGVSVPEDGPIPQSKVIRIKAVEFIPPNTKTKTKTVKDKAPVHKIIQAGSPGSKNAGGKSPGETDTSPRGAKKDTSPGSA